MSKIYLIDGMSVVFRAYHAMSASGMRSASGEITSAVFGFANIITSLMDKERPEHIAVIFDTREPTFRHKLYPLYKANRDAFPEDLVPQLARIKELIDLLGIPRAERPGYEADDIIGAVSKRASDEGHEVICLTSDKDYYQLVNDRVRLFKPSRNPGKDFDVVGIPEVFDKFGVSPDKVIDVLALIGDTSDNVPGVKGIGEKTAIPLIQEFGSLEGVYAGLDAIKSASVRKKLEADRESAFLSKTLVTIDVITDPEFDAEACKLREPDAAGLDAFFETLGLRQLRQKYKMRNAAAFIDVSAPHPNDSDFSEHVADDAPAEEEAVSAFKKLKDIPHEYIFADDNDKFDAVMAELSEKRFIAVDTETDSLDRQTCDLVGISLCAEEGRAFYIPISPLKKIPSSDFGTDGDQFDMFAAAPQEPAEKVASEEKFPDRDHVLSRLSKLLSDPNIEKCGQNIKFDAFILRRFGADIHPIAFDSMVASSLLNPDGRHGMDALSEKYLGYEPIHIAELIGEKKSKQISMRDVPQSKISDYAAEDADVTFRLCVKLKEELIKSGLDKTARDIEFPLIEALVETESNGVRLNTYALNDMTIMIERRNEELRKAIYAEAGTEFNLDSPKQLGHILFEKLMIPSVKQNKTGYSTDVGVLEQLAPVHPIANYLLEYRQINKLKSTYSKALPELINPETGRVHTTFNQTVTSTGRLSSVDPNLQNIPVRTELGREIRKAFVPAEGLRMISADYSQIEIRIMAYYSGDAHLIEAFKNGEDVHSATAAVLFSVEKDKVDSNMRRTAKTVNFGIMYGLGAFGLAERLGIPRGEASEIIKNYFEKYPGIRRYIDRTIDFAREHGYTETLCGRRRYYPNINAKNHNLRAADERAAINMPVQGTAADMMKIAMIKIYRAMKENSLKSKMLLQVHDELVFEAPPEEVDLLKRIIKDGMESALPLGEVPTPAEIGEGDNWFEAH